MFSGNDPPPDLYIFSSSQDVIHEAGCSNSTQFATDKSPTGRKSHYQEMKKKLEIFRTAMFPGDIHLYWMKKNSVDEMKQVKGMAKKAAMREVGKKEYIVEHVPST